MPFVQKVYPVRKKTSYTHTLSLVSKRNLRHQVKLSELPPIDSNHELLNSSGNKSLHVIGLQDLDSTFDRLCDGVTYQHKQRRLSDDDEVSINIPVCSDYQQRNKDKSDTLVVLESTPEVYNDTKVDDSIINLSDTIAQTLHVPTICIEDSILYPGQEESKEPMNVEERVASLGSVAENEEPSEFEITGNNIFTSTVINTSQCKLLSIPDDVSVEEPKEVEVNHCLQDDKESEETIKSLVVFRRPLSPQLIVTPGKSWRRSLAIAKRKSHLPSKSGGYDQVRNRETRPIFENLQEISLGVGDLQVTNQRITRSSKRASAIDEQNVAQLDIFTRCQQKAPLNFIRTYSHLTSRNCRKIGEGVYGEVFLFEPQRGASNSTVLKVIPIEGELLVNGERQKKFEEILSEIVIASELSNLVKTELNRTNVFNRLKKINCVKGKYQHTLRKCWHTFKEEKGTDNDDPTNFERSQLYIVLELDFAGIDLEKYVFNNYTEIFYLFVQVVLGIAVAEKELEFEHRDLHWGNVLVSKVNENDVCEFILNGKTIVLPIHGVRGTIIDFTLSRIRCGNQCYYNNLSDDPDLFKAHGDYQFDIYREMQKYNFDNWEKFTPYSNILWLHYLLDKMCTSVLLEKENKGASRNFSKLVKLKKDILDYKSASEFVTFRVLPLLS